MKKATANRRRSRGVTTAVAVILGVAVLALVASMVLPDATTVAPRGDDGKQHPSGGGTSIREDAVLSFLGADGGAIAAVTVEIASDDAARTRGLMGRTSMGETQGMLFLFPEEEMRSFWMANTPLPLDIIFVNAAKRIVTIQRNTVPYSEESVPSSAPAQYVVEVNAGYCDRHGINEGDMVSWMLAE